MPDVVAGAQLNAALCRSREACPVSERLAHPIGRSGAGSVESGGISRQQNA